MSERIFPFIENSIKQNEPYPGYPSQRLHLSPDVYTNESVVIPDGPWQLNDTDRPTSEDTTRYQQAGYKTDSLGRPLHPFFEQMVTNPNVGVVTGKGFYWNWGPNYTADSIVMTEEPEPRILLIKRGDTGAWALPGGFVDSNDSDDQQAAFRELEEETGLTIEAEGTLVYRGVVGDKRTTAHAWAETSAYLFKIPTSLPVQGRDDAAAAAWLPLSQIDKNLFGSHQFLIQEALNHFKSPLPGAEDLR